MADSNVQIVLSASDQTRAAFESAKANSESLSGSLIANSAAIAATAVAAAVGVAAMIKSSIDAADAMSKASQKVGTTTEMLSGLKYAAEMSDVSFESLQKSLGKLSSQAYNAVTSGGAAAASFANLGIEVKTADGHLKDSGVLLAEVADKFAAMPNSAEKSALAIELFGKQGMELIPLLNSGSDGLAEMSAEAERLGLIIGGDTALQAEAFNDNITRINKSFEGMANRIMADLAPALGELAEALADTTGNSDNLSGASMVIKTIFETIAVVGINVAYVFKSVGNEIGGIVAQADALAHADFKGFAAIGEQMKKDAEQARKDVDALSERILNPPKREKTAANDERGAVPVMESAEANKAMENMLAKSQQFTDELMASHKTAYEKNVEKFVEMERKLTEAGAAGNEQRKRLRAAFAAYTAEEQAKQDEEAQKKLDKETEQNNKLIETQQEKFTRMREQAEAVTASDEEKENNRYAAQMREIEREAEILEQKGLMELETKQKFLDAKEALGKAHAKKMEEIERNSDKIIVNGKIQYQKISLDSMSTFFGMAKGLMNSHSRAAFEIGKAAATAETLINTYKSATGAYSAMASIPIVGPALGIAAAAAAIVSGMAQVSAIQSSSFDSGGGAGGGSYGGASSGLNGGAATPNFPSVPDRPIPVEGVAAQATREVNITMSGDAQLFTAQSIREQLIPALNEAAGDGVTINVRTA